MFFERRAQREGLRVAREVPQTEQMPFVAALPGDGDFVTADVEGGAFPSVGGLDLDQTGTTVGLEARDVVAVANAILLGGLANLVGQVLLPA